MTSKLTLSLAEAKLFESGLTLADAKLLGLTFHDDLSVLHKQADQAEWRAGPGIKIPYFDLLGQPLETHPSWGPFWRTRRLEVPQEERSGFDKQTTGGPIAGVKKADHKYDQPPKTGTTAYFPPNLDWPSIAMDPEQSIILTEGEFKAMKSGKEGVPCIGLGGVWNYKSTETGVLFLQ
uniref:DUF3854 domain-containing protein n=1 Tax=Armatimonas sp. TaxID=1872638 RepID=UPI003753E144